MSHIGSIAASALAQSAAPVVTAAFQAPPLPAELGWEGQLADEQARYTNADRWARHSPWIVGLIGVIAGVSAGVALRRG